MDSPRPARAPSAWVALTVALILGPLGLAFWCLLAWGSTHGSKSHLALWMLLFGTIVCAPFFLVGVHARRRSALGRWTGGLAIAVGSLLAALFLLAVVQSI